MFGIGKLRKDKIICKNKKTIFLSTNNKQTKTNEEEDDLSDINLNLFEKNYKSDGSEVNKIESRCIAKAKSTDSLLYGFIDENNNKNDLGKYLSPSCKEPYDLKESNYQDKDDDDFGFGFPVSGALLFSFSSAV